jgi:hypothetical protein
LGFGSFGIELLLRHHQVAQQVVSVGGSTRLSLSELHKT